MINDSKKAQNNLSEKKGWRSFRPLYTLEMYQTNANAYAYSWIFQFGKSSPLTQCSSSALRPETEKKMKRKKDDDDDDEEEEEEREKKKLEPIITEI